MLARSRADRIRVRSSLFIGISLWVLTAPLAWAQQPPAQVAVCLPCHNAAAQGPEATATPGMPPIPRLNGQHSDYLTKQLQDFKAGRRKNDLMAPLLASLRTGQFPDLAAYFSSQPPIQGTAGDAQLAARGRLLFEEGNQTSGVPACIACHLPNGAGSKQYPRLAGQLPTYVIQQLNNFKSGARTNDRDKLMRNVAGRLTDDEMQAVAAYLAGL